MIGRALLAPDQAAMAQRDPASGPVPTTDELAMVTPAASAPAPPDHWSATTSSPAGRLQRSEGVHSPRAGGARHGVVRHPRRIRARRRTTAVVYDRSGLGRSPADPKSRTLHRLASDLLDHLGHGPFVLVAHSWGGPIVRVAAAASPGRVAGLVLVDQTDEGCDRGSGGRGAG